jgi:hypothetical protein
MSALRDVKNRVDLIKKIVEIIVLWVTVREVFKNDYVAMQQTPKLQSLGGEECQ